MTTPNTQNAAERIGPRQLDVRLTCEGCPALKTEEWKDYLDNDETDSGTRAVCSAAGGKGIDRYWSRTDPPPTWCPARELDSHRPAESVSAEPVAVPGAVWIYGSVSLVAHGSEEEWVRKRNAARLYLCPQPSTPGAVSDEDVEYVIRVALESFAKRSAAKCGCGLATCVEPWEPGCGLGTSKEHAVRVDAASSGRDAAHCGNCGATDGEGCGACPPAQAVSVPEWLPIETAPTNGLSVLVWQPWESGRNCILIGYYANGWVDQAHRELEPRPTYWQPLPAAPAAAAREGKE